jgi:Xaa-Pro aminopeptidase
VDQVWSQVGKTPMPIEKAWILEDKYNGEPVQSKFERLAGEFKDIDYLVVTTLDDIAWLLNLRGNDISFNPLFFSYLLFDVRNKKATLCANDNTVTDVLA